MFVNIKSITLKLEEYLKLGGKIENLNMKETTAYYCGGNPRYLRKRIIDLKLDKNNSNLYQVTFEDGMIQTFHPMWVELKVEFNLNKKYTK